MRGLFTIDCVRCTYRTYIPYEKWHDEKSSPFFFLNNNNVAGVCLFVARTVVFTTRFSYLISIVI